jgi:DNA-binding HxlR family transcriptional regulator
VTVKAPTKTSARRRRPPLAASRRPKKQLAAAIPPAKHAQTTLPQAAALLINLTHRRWSIPLLAELLRGDVAPGATKFITLANRLQISRDSLKSTLDSLIERDFVMRNPGYGHPMRPEYLLAEAGHDIAPACRNLIAWLNEHGHRKLAARKWSLPVAYAIGHGTNRFGDLKTVLHGITARALTLALKDLAGAGLVNRQVIDAYPPTSSYELTCAGRRLMPLLNAIVR